MEPILCPECGATIYPEGEFHSYKYECPNCGYFTGGMLYLETQKSPKLKRDGKEYNGDK